MNAATILTAACATAVFAWLSPASVHIVSWPATGPERIAVFAPLARLLWLLAATLVAAAALWMWLPRTGDARRRRAGVLAPLLLLWLSAVPYVPVLPDRAPVLLVFAGPLRWFVLALAIVFVLLRLADVRRWTWPRTALAGPRIIFALSLVIYLACGFRSLASVGLKGDEPHYLIISQSLLADGDLAIENNHRRREYRAFTREELPPDYMQRGKNGEIYSIHAPGLPALLLPAYAGFGQYGALVVLCFFGALAATAVFELARMVATPPIALVTWTAVALTVPFNPYVWAIFPEMPCAAIVGWAAVWLLQEPRGSSRQWLWRGVCLALLPWLHTKFVIFLAGLVVLMVVRMASGLPATKAGLTAFAKATASAAEASRRRKARHYVAFVGPIALSLVAWFGFFWVIYGTPNPEAPYGNYARDWVKLAFVPRGVLGLLLDQKFGLLIYTPIYVLVPIGLWLVRRDARWRWPTWALVALAAAFTVSSARLYMWWGGWSAPARFMVPALPLLVPALAFAIDVMARRWRAAIVVMLSTSLAISMTSAIDPARLLLFSDAHGVSRLADEVQGSAPLTASLPTFTESEWQPRDLVPRPYPASVRRASVVKGRIGLLTATRADRVAIDLSTRRILDANAWRAAGAITPEMAPADGPPPLDASGVFPEGDVFWTQGTTKARLLVANRGGEKLNVTVHVGPAGGRCRLVVGGDRFDDPLQPNETRQLTLAIDSAASWIPIAVQATQAFRPADVDSTTQDQRLLGCQVRVAF